MEVAKAGGAEREVRAMCRLCLNRCGVVATVRNEKVVRIDGDAANPYNQGRACAKGRAGFYTIDSPYRVTRPLRRTNAQKGPGIDPGWETISWENALDIVAAKLKEIGADDPRNLWRVTFDRSLLDESPNLDAPLPSGAKVDVMLASPILGG